MTSLSYDEWPDYRWEAYEPDEGDELTDDDAPPPDDEDDECPHASVTELSGYPDSSGRMGVYAVCEDCGKEMGQVGWDAV